ncbi:MAG: glycosyltransferase [Candidatus Latescibacterota bacterium]
MSVEPRPARAAEPHTVPSGRTSLPDVSVVVVHYRTPRLLDRCLSHLQACPSRVHLETIVVDNASPESQVAQTAARLGPVRFQRHARNLGFAAACNQGLHLGQGRYCLLLNPDVSIDGPAIDGLVDLLDQHPEAAVAAPRLVHLDGSLQLSCRRFPSLRAILLRGLHLRRLAPAAPTTRCAWRPSMQGLITAVQAALEAERTATGLLQRVRQVKKGVLPPTPL